jgi:hypothetical protein
MPKRSSILLIVIGALVALPTAAALADDVETCMRGSERATAGPPLGEDEKRAAHEACQRALAAESNVVNKYQLQEADFDIIGRPPH